MSSRLVIYFLPLFVKVAGEARKAMPRRRLRDEAPASKLGHLFADELLFVVAIAQALLCDGGVRAEAFKQVVAAQPGFKLDELGVKLTIS